MYLFVYGTLQSGGRASGMLREARLMGTATLDGSLYDVAGEYPALVLDGSGSVHGEVWEGPEAMLTELDRYEGVDQALFQRVRVELLGRPCWVYVAGPALLPRLRREWRLPHGRWPAA